MAAVEPIRYSKTVIIALSVTLAVLVAVVATIIVLNLGDGEEPAASTPPASPSASPTVEPDEPDQGPSTDPQPSPDVPPSADTPPAPQPDGTKTVKVYGTLGDNWKRDNDQEGWIAVRTSPTKSGKRVAKLNEGQSVDVVCATTGMSYRSSLLGITSKVWARTVDGRYIAALYLLDSNENLQHAAGQLEAC